MVLPDVQGDPSVLQFVPTAFCPGAGHHWHELGFILSAPSYPLSQLGDVLPAGSLFDHLPMKISSTKRLVTKHSAHALSAGQIGSFYRSWALPFTNCQLFYGPPNCHHQGRWFQWWTECKVGCFSTSETLSWTKPSSFWCVGFSPSSCCLLYLTHITFLRTGSVSPQVSTAQLANKTHFSHWCANWKP